MKQNRILAIDVGNGFGKAALCTGDNQDPLFLLPHGMSCGMRTVAYITDDGIEVAHNVRGRKPEGRSVRTVKSFIGTGEGRTTDDGTPYDPNKVYGVLARELIHLANVELKKLGIEPIYDVVLTYPSSFVSGGRMDKVEIMRKAVEEQQVDGQDVHVMATISEAAAAAVDNVYYERNLRQGVNLADRSEYNVAVYDLGHGTLDVAVVMSTSDINKPYDVVCQDGDPEIGGRIFNEKLYELCCDTLRDDHKITELTAQEKDQLKNHAVPQIKHELSNDDESIYDQLNIDGDQLELTIKKGDFEGRIEKKVRATLSKLAEILEAAKSKDVSVNEIILTGGSSRIPMIQKLAKDAISESYPGVEVRLNRPEQGVVFGAARYAAGLEIKEHPEFAYGVRYHDGTRNMIAVCLKSDDDLAARGGSVRLTPEGVALEVGVFRSVKRGVNDGPIPQSECENAQFFSFDVGTDNRGKECTVAISMDTERRLSAHCTLPDGRVLDDTGYRKES